MGAALSFAVPPGQVRESCTPVGTRRCAAFTRGFCRLWPGSDAAPLLCLVGKHDDRYSLRPGPVHGVLDPAAVVDLEHQQFICHIHHVLVPPVVRGDIHHLRALGMLDQAARLRHGFQLPNQLFRLLCRDDPFGGPPPVVSARGTARPARSAVRCCVIGYQHGG